MSSFKLEGESASGGDVVRLCQDRVSPLSHSRPLTLAHRKPTPDTDLWRPWAEAGEHLRIGEHPPSSRTDVSPSMDMSEEVVARMDFWADICGGGCMYGSGLGTMHTAERCLLPMSND